MEEDNRTALMPSLIVKYVSDRHNQRGVPVGGSLVMMYYREVYSAAGMLPVGRTVWQECAKVGGNNSCGDGGT